MFVCILRHFKRYSEKGNVLLSTILIMGLSLNIGLVIAVLSLSGFSRTKNIKSQALSYYAAESGAEASLYKVRKGSKEVEKLNLENINNPEVDTTWQSKGQIRTSAIQEDLEEDRSIVLYLYNPQTWASGISNFQITWQDTCNKNSSLEILKIFPITEQAQLDNLDWNNPNEIQSFSRGEQSIDLNNGTTGLYLFSDIAYAIKITAHNCYVNYLKLEGYYEGNSVDLNVENIITSTGTASDVKQTIRVSM